MADTTGVSETTKIPASAAYIERTVVTDNRSNSNGLLMASFKLPNWLWGKNTAQACSNKEVTERAQQLIKQEIPDLGVLFGQMRELDQQRTGGTDWVIKYKEEQLQKIRDQYARDPARISTEIQRRNSYISELEDELDKLRTKKAAEKQRTQQPTIQLPDIQVISDTEPFAVAFNKEIDRVTCEMTYKIKGGGYDAVPGVGGEYEKIHFTVQPGKDDWIINLVPIR